MAIPPKFSGQVFSSGVSPKALHTLEFYLDYVCPFSAKMFKTLHSSVFPLAEQKYASKVQFIFRQVYTITLQASKPLVDTDTAIWIIANPALASLQHSGP